MVRRFTPAVVAGSTLALVSGACGTGDSAASPDASVTTAAPAVDDATTFDLPGTLEFPEGIAVDKATGRLYVGSTADGSIHRSITDDPADGFEVFLPPDPTRSEVVGVKVRNGLLFAAGRRNGTLHVHEIETGEVIATLTTPETERTLVNDISFDADHVYVTDSFRPVVFRARLDGLATADRLEEWLDLTATPLTYEDGFNLNGITASDDGTVLLTVQSNTGTLWRIDIATRGVSAVDLGDADLATGDGLLLDGTTLHAVTNSPDALVRIELDDDLRTGVVTDVITDPSLDLPTTIAEVGGALYAVNSQLDDAPGEETQPFTLTRVPFEP